MTFYTVSLWDAQRGEAVPFRGGQMGLIIEAPQLVSFVESAHRENLRPNVARAVPADIDRQEIEKALQEVNALLEGVAFSGGWRIVEMDNDQSLLKLLIYPKISDIGELVPKRAADPL
jgi:hypothetical protein